MYLSAEREPLPCRLRLSPVPTEVRSRIYTLSGVGLTVGAELSYSVDDNLRNRRRVLLEWMCMNVNVYTLYVRATTPRNPAAAS